MANSTSDRTKKLLKTVSEIVDLPTDKELNRLDPSAKENLLTGGEKGNTKKVKKKIQEILNERIVVDATTGEERVDRGGNSNPSGINHGGKDSLSVTDFDQEELEEAYNDTLEAAEAVKVKVKSTKALLEAVAASASEEVTTIKVNTRTDRNLRTAIKRIYGKKTDVITFDMYKQALELRNRFNEEEVAATTDGEIDI